MGYGRIFVSSNRNLCKHGGFVFLRKIPISTKREEINVLCMGVCKVYSLASPLFIYERTRLGRVHLNLPDPRGAGLHLGFQFSYVRSLVCLFVCSFVRLLRSKCGPYTFIKGQRDKGTKGQRDKWTKGQMDKGTKGQRGKGTKGQTDKPTNRQRNKGTK